MGYIYTRDSLLLVMADGMGGHVRGEMAAAITIQTIANLFQKSADPYVKRPEVFLEDSFIAAHREIQRYADLYKLPETPRTTVVACLIQHNSAVWAHCGDSRLYWMRNGQILARTQDHSRVATLIAQGMLDPAHTENHPDRNKLFNCLGSSNMPIVEISRRASLQSGDTMLLCTDGLWSIMPDHILAKQISDTTIMRAIPELLDKSTSIAGRNGDNATALAVTWLGEEGSSREAPIEEATTTTNTNTLQIGAVTSMLVTQTSSGDKSDVFNESEIEKAIDEIRSAIQQANNTQ